MKPAVPAEVARRAQEAYQVQLAHVTSCPQCRAVEPCEDGRRIRRAVQAARLVAEAANPTDGCRDSGRQ